MCVCIYVCMCLYVYVCMYACMYVWMYDCVYMLIVCMCVYVYIDIWLHLCIVCMSGLIIDTYIDINALTHGTKSFLASQVWFQAIAGAQTYSHQVYICMYVWMCLYVDCVSVYMYAHPHTHTYIYIYIYVYIYIYIFLFFFLFFLFFFFFLTSWFNITFYFHCIICILFWMLSCFSNILRGGQTMVRPL